MLNIKITFFIKTAKNVKMRNYYKFSSKLFMWFLQVLRRHSLERVPKRYNPFSPQVNIKKFLANFFKEFFRKTGVLTSFNCKKSKKYSYLNKLEISIDKPNLNRKDQYSALNLKFT